MKIFDAHIHFDRGSVVRIRELLDCHIIDGAVVILNKAEDFAAFEKNKDELPSGRVRYAAIVDAHAENPLEFIDRWKSFDMALKLHPRINRITKKDIPYMCSLVEKASTDVIIIDCMGYGHQYNNHIGLELGIEIALAFPHKKIVFAHAGGERLMECFLYTRTLDNAYYDISLVSTYFSGTHVYDDLCHFIRYNTERIMFGSDYPDFDPEYCIAAVKELCAGAGLSKKETKKIFYDNAIRIYNMEGDRNGY